MANALMSRLANYAVRSAVHSKRIQRFNKEIANRGVYFDRKKDYYNVYEKVSVNVWKGLIGLIGPTIIAKGTFDCSNKLRSFSKKMKVCIKSQTQSVREVTIEELR